MASRKGIIALMGSGELTATMVEVHKELLDRFGSAPQAVFLDTPAGFQLNVDQISRRATAYFRQRVQRPLSIASLKSADAGTPYEAEQAFQRLRTADYILIGPGSPTYAVRQLQTTPVPEILVDKVRNSGCLVAASAAALTVGRLTLPVYEIYKVGQDLHWVEGMNILGRLGFNLVVIPHWNNAEGGTHDTRYCFMGRPRFERLTAMLPDDVSIFGLDEHTACIIDLEAEEAWVRGIGRAVLLKGGRRIVFEKGDRFSVDVLRGAGPGKMPAAQPQTADEVRPPVEDGHSATFWDQVHRLRTAFVDGLEQRDPKAAVNALLELDRTLWQAQTELENEEFISQGREVLRDLIVLLGPVIEVNTQDNRDPLMPLIEEFVALREKFRQSKQWAAADAVRDTLLRADIVIEDTRDGPRWRRANVSADGSEKE